MDTKRINIADYLSSAILEPREKMPQDSGTILGYLSQQAGEKDAKDKRQDNK